MCEDGERSKRGSKVKGRESEEKKVRRREGEGGEVREERLAYFDVF